MNTYLYRLASSDELPRVSADPAVTWRLISTNEVDSLCSIGPFEVSDCPPRFLRGDLCYGAFLDGRLAHYSWVQRAGLHPIIEAGRSVPVENGHLWLYQCRTAEWARGRKIYPATLQLIARDAFADACTTAWIYTSRENVASQRGIGQAGFTQVGTLLALRVGTHYFRRD